MEIVALFAGLLALGYRSHLILTTFANVLRTYDPIQFYTLETLLLADFLCVVLFNPFLSDQISVQQCAILKPSQYLKVV